MVRESRKGRLPVEVLEKRRRPTIVIADDHALVAEGLASLLAKEFDIIATVEGGGKLVDIVGRLKPDLALVDVSMRDMNGLEAVRQMRELDVSCKVVFVTMHCDAEYVREAFRVGACGYVVKRSTAAELFEAIRQVLSGNTYISPFVAKDIMSLVVEPQAPGLTQRQTEVLRLIAEGRSGKEIAGSLSISLKTAQFHKTSIAGKLGVRTTAELTRYALKHGIAS